MRRILIFGNSASGKSTLAKQLSCDQGLAHLDLDTLAWQQSSPPTRKPLDQSAKSLKNFMQSSDNWVIEGCYADLLAIAAPFANEVIFMDLPVSLCIDNAKNRPWEPHKYTSRQAQDDNLDMLIDWISQYQQRQDTFSAQSHLNLYDKFAGKKTRYIDNHRDN